MNARTLIVAAGVAGALAGAAVHSAGAANTLHCTAAAHRVSAASVSKQKPFYSPLNPRGLLSSGGGKCVTKAAVKVTTKGHTKPKPKPQPKPFVPVTPGPDVTPPVSPVGPLCPTVTDDTEGELSVCSATVAPVVDSAGDDQTASQPDATADQSADATSTDDSGTASADATSTGDSGTASADGSDPTALLS
jgi:hypothetical protein